MDYTILNRAAEIGDWIRITKRTEHDPDGYTGDSYDVGSVLTVSRKGTQDTVYSKEAVSDYNPKGLVFGDEYRVVELMKDIPEIPRFVADWMKKNPSTSWWRKIANWEVIVPEEDREVFNWYQNYNENDFIMAWVSGRYRIAKERPKGKYIVIVKTSDDSSLFLWKRGGVVKSSVALEDFSTAPDNLRLTEDEIKDFDERLWPFAEPAKKIF